MAVTRIGVLRVDYKHTLDQQIDQATSAISQRTTSWVGDEAVCLAIILGLDVLKIARTAREKRMEVPARMWEIVPRFFLFLPIPHLSTPALRWMPKSFLGTGLRGQRTSTFKLAERHTRGLAFAAEGAFISFGEPLAGSDEIIFDYEDKSYLVLPSPHEEEIWWDLTERRIAVIFETSPHEKCLVRAVLVSLRKRNNDDIWPHVIYARYVLSAQASLEKGLL